MRTIVLVALVALVTAQTTTPCGVCPSDTAVGTDDCRVRGDTCTGGGSSRCGNGDQCTTDADCVGRSACSINSYCEDSFGAEVYWLPQCGGEGENPCEVCFHLEANGAPHGGTCAGDVEATPCTISDECRSCTCVTAADHLEACDVTPCDVCAQFITATASIESIACNAAGGTNVSVSVTCTDARALACSPLDIAASFVFALDGAPLALLSAYAPGGEACAASVDLVECALSSDVAEPHTFTLVVTLDTTVVGGNVTVAVDKINKANEDLCQDLTPQDTSFAIVPTCTAEPTSQPTAEPTSQPTPAPTLSACDVCEIASVTFDAEYLCNDDGTGVRVWLDYEDSRPMSCGQMDAALYISILDPSNSNASVPLLNATFHCRLENETTAICPFSVSGGSQDVYVTSDIITSRFLDPSNYIVNRRVVRNGALCSLDEFSAIANTAPYCNRPSCQECAFTTSVSTGTATNVCLNATTARTNYALTFVDGRDANTCEAAPRRFIVAVAGAALFDDVVVRLDGVALSECATNFVDNSVACNVSVAAGLEATFELEMLTGADADVTMDVIVSDVDGRACPGAGASTTVTVPPCSDDCNVCATQPGQLSVQYACYDEGTRAYVIAAYEDTRHAACGPLNATLFLSLVSPESGALALARVASANDVCELVDATTVGCVLQFTGGDVRAEVEVDIVVAGFLEANALNLERRLVIDGTRCTPDVIAPTVDVAPYCLRSACQECASTTSVGNAVALTTCANTSVARTRFAVPFVDSRDDCEPAPRKLRFIVNATLLDDAVVHFNDVAVSGCVTFRDEGIVECDLGDVPAGLNALIEVDALLDTDASAPAGLQAIVRTLDVDGRMCPDSGESTTDVARPPCARETRVIPASLRAYALARCRLVSRNPNETDASECGDGDEERCFSPDVTQECLDSNCCHYVDVPLLESIL